MHLNHLLGSSTPAALPVLLQAAAASSRVVSAMNEPLQPQLPQIDGDSQVLSRTHHEPLSAF